MLGVLDRFFVEEIDSLWLLNLETLSKVFTSKRITVVYCKPVKNNVHIKCSQQHKK